MIRVLGDQQSSCLGHVLDTGEVKNTYGTGSFILMNIGDKLILSKRGLLTTLLPNSNKKPHEIQYALEGAIETAGVVVNWLKNNMKFFSNYKELETLYESVNNSNGVIFVPAFSGLYSPYWDNTTSGTIFGLSMQTQKGNLIRAAYEAISFRTKEVIENLQKDANIQVKVLKVDGGLSESKHFLQTQANILGEKVLRQREKEITIIGSAIAAGLEKDVNLWQDKKEISKILKFDKSFESEMNENERNNLREKWNKAVSRAKNWY